MNTLTAAAIFGAIIPACHGLLVGCPWMFFGVAWPASELVMKPASLSCQHMPIIMSHICSLWALWMYWAAHGFTAWHICDVTYQWPIEGNDACTLLGDAYDILLGCNGLWTVVRERILIPAVPSFIHMIDWNDSCMNSICTPFLPSGISLFPWSYNMAHDIELCLLPPICACC